MQLLQRSYISILTPIYRRTQGLQESTRDTVRFVCVFLLMTGILLDNSDKFLRLDLSNAVQAVVHVVLLLVIIIMSVNAPLAQVKWNRLFCIPYFLICLWTIFAGLHHNIGATVACFTIIMFLVFPCLYFVWNHRGDYERLFDTVAQVLVVSGLLYFCIAAVVAPLGAGTLQGDRYIGTMNGPNRIAMEGVVMVMGSLYLLLRKSRFQWLCRIGAGVGVFFAVAGMSRTSILAIGAQFLCYIIFSIKAMEKKSRKRVLLRMLVLCCTVAVCVPLCFLVMAVSNKFGFQTVHPTVQKYKTEAAKKAAQRKKTNPAETSKGKEQKATAETTKNKNSELNLAQRFDPRNKTADQLSAGRLWIWNWHYKRFNLLGNDCTNHYIPMPGTDVRHYWAHNTPIEYAYRCGVSAGALYLLIELLALAYIFNCLRKRKHVPSYCYFVTFAAVAFLIESTLDIQIATFNRAITLCFFLVLAPMFADGRAGAQLKK